MDAVRGARQLIECEHDRIEVKDDPFQYGTDKVFPFMVNAESEE